VTCLEEAPSSTPDLLIGREYKTHEHSVFCRSLTQTWTNWIHWSKQSQSSWRSEIH